MNREWHLTHPMPKNPTLDQRIDWHIEHLKNCACRELTPKLKEEFKKRKSENVRIQKKADVQSSKGVKITICKPYTEKDYKKDRWTENKHRNRNQPRKCLLS